MRWPSHITFSRTQTGSLGKRPLNDIIVNRQPNRGGPFLGAAAVRMLHDKCEIEITKDIPIVFTHNDLCPPNIMVSHGPNPRVVAILDCGQSGWYPSYREYCKAQRVGAISEEFDCELQQEWHINYLPRVIDIVDDELYHPWLYFMLSNM